MKESKTIMGMDATIEVVDSKITKETLEEIFDYLINVDKRFSTYKKTSEITLLNEGKIKNEDLSDEMKEVLFLSEKTKNETSGFFDIMYDGKIDPSGLVKGWAIYKVAEFLRKKSFMNFYVEVAGDIEVSGLNKEGRKWAIGIRNPFNKSEIIKVVYLTNKGIATSGTYERGEHIYNPKDKKLANEIVSLTVIGPNVYEADRFATAAFAMGVEGINFIQSLSGFEAYMIGYDKIATLTSDFESYLK